ncbi:MAG: aspartate--tRNA ligase [Candidatus Woesearchaeota archaeon]|nr:aspartate--tRNA ligase [Candidatus Woesearchaeota archaeon]
MHRTHTCGELRKEHAGEEVTLSGWVHVIREHGSKQFVDLRDRYGVTQVVLEEKADIRRETVVKVTGKVVEKPKANEKLATGEIEVQASSCKILGPADPIPMEPEAENTEETRLKYRYLDLRRPDMQAKLQFRDDCASSVRKHMHAHGFTEVETPILMKSTPEGARDYIVPSRLHKGKFYALPQSPQIYKQILMVAGMDKYFQIVKCFRDEDLRADRQPEFTQVDVEMSFVEQDDVIALGDELLKNVVKDVLGKDVKTPFPRLSYAEAMDKYGIDKPDARFELFLHTLTELVKDSEFKVFSEAPCVRCLVAPALSRKQIDKYTELAKTYKAKGLAYLQVTKDGVDSPIKKFLSDEVVDKIVKETGAKPDSTILFVADKEKVANDALAHIRNALGKQFELYDPEELNFLWVLDFPLFEWNEDTKDWTPMHHMFTMPHEEHLQYLESDPGKVLAQAHDIVLNGTEIGGGSIRVHHKDVQERVMKAMNISEEDAKKKFGFMLEAFQYGAPPHGGFALGFDRMVALFQGETDIREYIAFPKNKAAQSLMDDAPSDVEQEQLDELHLTVKK